jgi:hypothetical protein
LYPTPFVAVPCSVDNIVWYCGRDRTTMCRFGEQMLSALERCHSVGILHRDVKPGASIPACTIASALLSTTRWQMSAIVLPMRCNNSREKNELSTCDVSALFYLMCSRVSSLQVLSSSSTLIRIPLVSVRSSLTVGLTPLHTSAILIQPSSA